MNRPAYTIRMPIAISTAARPMLNATMSRSPKPTRFSANALRSTTTAAGQGTMPPLMPSATRPGRRDGVAWAGPVMVIVVVVMIVMVVGVIVVGVIGLV